MEWDSLGVLGGDGSWVQIMRTFGDPVLEGRFAVRAHVEKGLLCLVMWDLGDRVLGLGQFEGQSSAVLWPLLEAVLGRKPDIAIGDPRLVYRASHFETAHWHLSKDLARSVGRPEQHGGVHGRRWIVPSSEIGVRIRPLMGGLLPPQGNTLSHVVWHEPDPALPDVGDVGRVYILGSGMPGMDVAMAYICHTGRMMAAIDRATALAFLQSNGRSVYIPVQTSSGRSLGRVRILTI
jgi:hypothetical protein